MFFQVVNLSLITVLRMLLFVTLIGLSRMERTLAVPLFTLAFASLFAADRLPVARSTASSAAA